VIRFPLVIILLWSLVAGIIGWETATMSRKSDVTEALMAISYACGAASVAASVQGVSLTPQLLDACSASRKAAEAHGWKK
jgi:CHASE2 domain-containing sensor protein